MVYWHQGRKDFCGGQDEKSGTDTIWTCEEHVHKYPSEKAWEVEYNGYNERNI